jgi:hypothetical protein
MSFFDNFPTTNFKLSDGSSVESFNIFKTFIIDDNIKNNIQNKKIKTVNSINRIENLNNINYLSIDDYWLIPYMNDIKSFRDLPIDESKFQLNLQKKYSGVVYYVKDGKDILNILPGDMVILYNNTNDPPTPDDWYFSGIVKEYDTTFRRIILDQEFENEDSTGTISDKIYIYRKNQGNSWQEISSGDYEQGRKELEIDKVISIHTSPDKSETISQFKSLNVDSYDFSSTPASDIIIHQLCNDITSDLFTDYYFTTLKEKETDIELERKNLNFVSIKNANALSLYVGTLSSSSFNRGKILNII